MREEIVAERGKKQRDLAGGRVYKKYIVLRVYDNSMYLI
jgi:hypothetical protein